MSEEDVWRAVREGVEGGQAGVGKCLQVDLWGIGEVDGGAPSGVEGGGQFGGAGGEAVGGVCCRAVAFRGEDRLAQSYNITGRELEEGDELHLRHEDKCLNQHPNPTAKPNRKRTHKNNSAQHRHKRYEPVFRNHYQSTWHSNQDSNQFHAICLDTYPPIFYLNEFSKSVIQIVDRRLNKVLKHKIAYTFDAGPHAFLIVHADVFEETFAYLLRIYEPTEEQLNERARNCKKNIKMGKELEEEVFVPEYRPSAIWVTKVGKGPIDVSN